MENEFDLFGSTIEYIVGIDEVGRGPWAGPLYLCGFCLTRQDTKVEGVRDSKKVSKMKREKLFSELLASNHYLVEKSSVEIDRLGLAKALNSSVDEILKYFMDQLGSKVGFLIDGNFQLTDKANVIMMSKADDKYYSVAAASIIAKVTRDRVMGEIAQKYPDYGFESHVGYGTQKHEEAIKIHGIIDGVHRKSFKPIQSLEF